MDSGFLLLNGDLHTQLEIYHWEKGKNRVSLIRNPVE